MAFNRLQLPSAARRDVEFLYGSIVNLLEKTGWLASGPDSSNPFGMVKAGTVLGRVTLSGKYVPCVNTTCETDDVGSAVQTLASVENVYPGQVHRFVTTGVDRTVLEVNRATRAVTYTAAVSPTEGEVVRANDGSQDPVGFLRRTTSTWETVDPDDHTASIHEDRQIAIVINGAVVEARCTGITPAIKAALKAQSITFV